MLHKHFTTKPHSKPQEKIPKISKVGHHNFSVPLEQFHSIPNPGYNQGPHNSIHYNLYIDSLKNQYKLEGKQKGKDNVHSLEQSVTIFSLIMCRFKKTSNLFNLFLKHSENFCVKITEENKPKLKTEILLIFR